MSSLAFLKDVGYLASGSWDQTIRLWDLKEGKLITTLKGHSQWVCALSYIEENDCLASAGVDKIITTRLLYIIEKFIPKSIFKLFCLNILK